MTAARAVGRVTCYIWYGLVWLFKLVLMSVVQATCKSLFGMAFQTGSDVCGPGHVQEPVWYGFQKLNLMTVVYRSRARACLLWLSKTGSDR